MFAAQYKYKSSIVNAILRNYQETYLPWKLIIQRATPNVYFFIWEKNLF